MRIDELKGCDKSCIYRIDFPDGKSYIGKTVDISGRISLYRNNLLSGKSSRVLDALREYGIDNVEIVILVELYGLDRDDLELCLSILEIKYIRSCGTLYPDGYNVSIGGELLGIPTDSISTDFLRTDSGSIRPCRPILVYDLDGKFVEEYPSIERCAYSFGVTPTSVSSHIDKRCDIFHGKYMLRWKRYGIVPDSILPFKPDVVEKRVVRKVYEDKVIVREHIVRPRHTILKYDSDGNFCGEYDTLLDAALSIGRKHVQKGVLVKGYMFVEHDGGEIREQIGKIPRNIRMPKYSSVLDAVGFSPVESVSDHRWGSLINDFKVDQYTLSGEYIATFDSINRASYETGIPYSSIWGCVFGRTRRGKGYIWRKHIEVEDSPLGQS